ncbi:histidinol-phosphate transaminase [Albidovulum sp.]|uniref:histidinol-phosphate transaminase n=1 Tax=Albidovulum sp. TaxID=1872424 RepID=UPI0039B95494
MTDEDATASDSRLIRPEIANLPDYNAGLALERFRAIYGLDARAKLDSNENPLGPSPDAIAEIRKAAATVSRYPDAASIALRAAIAATTGVSAEQVIIGNGSEDLIGAVFRTVLRPGDRVVTLCPSFGLHEFGALALGAAVEKVRFGADWRFPLAALKAALARPARVLIFSSPSNPAGPVIATNELRDLLAAAPSDTLVILDEAYLEYVAPEVRFDALPVLAEGEQPWIALRTFSKAYGLAGLRVGYGISSDRGLIRSLMKSRNPFGVNALAGAAALAALADVAHLAKATSLARAERARIAEALEAKGYPVAPSQANFLFFETGGAAGDLAEGLRRKGVLIKAWQEEPFRNWARVTMGTAAENDAFIAALPEIGRPQAASCGPR